MRVNLLDPHLKYRMRLLLLFGCVFIVLPVFRLFFVFLRAALPEPLRHVVLVYYTTKSEKGNV